MELAHNRTYGSIERSFEVIGGPVMRHPNSSTKKIRVTYLSVKFSMECGEWVADSWSASYIGGVVLKKDGTEGKETWSGQVAYDWAKQKEYDWVRKVIEGIRPEGVPVLPFRVSGIETDDLED